jgi:cytochrome c
VGKEVMQGGDAERGKTLFADPALGGSKSDKSCNTCHPEGKGLENTGGDIAGAINACIEKALEGKPLAADSQELKDLVAYVASLKK